MTHDLDSIIGLGAVRSTDGGANACLARWKIDLSNIASTVSRHSSDDKADGRLGDLT
jgi:hypothetical protein